MNKFFDFCLCLFILAATVLLGLISYGALQDAVEKQQPKLPNCLKVPLPEQECFVHTSHQTGVPLTYCVDIQVYVPGNKQ